MVTDFEVAPDDGDNWQLDPPPDTKLAVFPRPMDVFITPLPPYPQYICTAYFPHMQLQPVLPAKFWVPLIRGDRVATEDLPFPSYTARCGSSFEGMIRNIIEGGI